MTAKQRDTRPASQGRPRDPAADRAIMEAAIAEIADTGYEQTSFESIARRSGVSRTTIYRRYRDKADLVVAAVAEAFDQANPGVPATGDALEDVVTLLYNTARMLTGTPAGAVFRAIIPALPRDPSLSKLARRLEHRRRRLLLEAIGRGIEQGQLRTVDVDATIDTLLGAIYLRFLLLQKPIDRAYIEGITAAALAPDPFGQATGMIRLRKRSADDG